MAPSSIEVQFGRPSFHYEPNLLTGAILTFPFKINRRNQAEIDAIITVQVAYISHDSVIDKFSLLERVFNDVIHRFYMGTYYEKIDDSTNRLYYSQEWELKEADETSVSFTMIDGYTILIKEKKSFSSLFG